MENASKALMIAGGILLAILILSMGVYIWQIGSNFMSQSEEQKEQERMKAFNQEYESYQRQTLRGADIITIINKVRDNNIRNGDAEELLINWEVQLKRDFTDMSNRIILKKGIHTENSSGAKVSQILADEEVVKSFKALYFKCKSLGYNENGRVNKIVFEEYLTSEIFGI